MQVLAFLELSGVATSLVLDCITGIGSSKAACNCCFWPHTSCVAYNLAELYTNSFVLSSHQL